MNFIKLFNVEFDDKYDDVIMFATKAQQSSYFAARFIEEFEHDELSVIKELQAVRVYGNYNKLQTVNYAYFENEIDGVIRGYYAFVTSVSWAGIGVVSLSLSVDVFQTYLFEHALAPSYVRRAHVHQYDEQNYPITKYLCTPENVDYGDEYLTSGSEYIENNTYNGNTERYMMSAGSSIAWVVLVGTDSIKDNDNIEVTTRAGFIGERDALRYIAIPVIIGGDNNNLSGKITTGELWGQQQWGDYEKIGELMTPQTVFSHFAASTQIIGIYILRSMPIQLTVSTISNTNQELRIKVQLPPQGKYDVAWKYTTEGKTYGVYIPAWDKNDLIFTKRLNIYTFDKSLDLKAQCYPYLYFSITNDRANEVIVKPQYMPGTLENTDYSLILNCAIWVSIGAYAKQGIGVMDYTGTPGLRQVVDTALGQMPQVTNAYLNFLQTQKASFDTGLNHTYENGVYNALGQIGAMGQNLLMQNYAGAAQNAAGLAQGVRSTAQRIEAQQARVQDIRNTPDSLKKSGTDIKYEIISGYWGVYVTPYQITPEAQQRVSDYFTLYGYTINDFIKDFAEFLDSRDTYNFVQTNACRVTGNINVSHIRALEQIYDHGVRLWHYDAATWSGFDFNKPNGDYYGQSRAPQAV